MPYKKTSAFFDMEVGGGPEVNLAFLLLPKRVFSKVARRANQAAVLPTLKAARKGTTIFNPKKSTGAYKKALTRKTKQYKSSMTTFSMVGARADFMLKGRRPNKYAHLLEFGHRFTSTGAAGSKLDRKRQSRSGKWSFERGNDQEAKIRARPYPLIGNAYKATGRLMQKEFTKAMVSGTRKEAQGLARLGLRWMP